MALGLLCDRASGMQHAARKTPGTLECRPGLSPTVSTASFSLLSCCRCPAVSELQFGAYRSRFCMPPLPRQRVRRGHRDASIWHSTGDLETKKAQILVGDDKLRDRVHDRPPLIPLRPPGFCTYCIPIGLDSDARQGTVPASSRLLNAIGRTPNKEKTALAVESSGQRSR